ncbi:MAG: hypothetical protein H6Q84_3717, partial [Deltaproteobacteria bacterium]|nr:hypothetical protein [Deltaproteobacteria bacterium]
MNRVPRNRWLIGIAILFALFFAGCGGGDSHDRTTSIYSDISVDADVTRDLGTDQLSVPYFAANTGNVLAGVTFTLPSGPSTADTRGFLQFPLS